MNGIEMKGLKTLVIGDTHLKMGVLKNKIIEIVKKESIEEVVFLGDYFDEWQCNYNENVYYKECHSLKNIKIELNEMGVKTVFLIGNHDLQYIIRDYTSQYILHSNNHELKELIRNTLIQDLEVKFVHQIGYDYLASHAGFTNENTTTLFYFETLNDEVIYKHLSELKRILYDVSYARGGSVHSKGSFIWSDFGQDLVNHPNKKYKKQIVGHTPVESIANVHGLINVDTFSMTPRLKHIGNTEVLIINQNNSLNTSVLFEDLSTYEQLVFNYLKGEKY